MTERRWPVHLAVLVGLSASAYGGSLAAVTFLQASMDAAVAAQREPVRRLADSIAVGHDTLEAALADASRRYGRMTDRYGTLLPDLAQAETSLDLLAKTTSSVTNSVHTLPSRASLPAVPAATRIARAAPPAIHATTGASGR